MAAFSVNNKRMKQIVKVNNISKLQHTQSVELSIKLMEIVIITIHEKVYMRTTVTKKWSKLVERREKVAQAFFASQHKRLFGQLK